jgi:hypothetical protein
MSEAFPVPGLQSAGLAIVSRERRLRGLPGNLILMNGPLASTDVNLSRITAAPITAAAIKTTSMEKEDTL